MTEVNGEPTMATNKISAKLGVNVSAKFIEEKLGIPPDVKTNTGCFWLESKFPTICYELSKHFFDAQIFFLRDMHRDRFSQK